MIRDINQDIHGVSAADSFYAAFYQYSMIAIFFPLPYRTPYICNKLLTFKPFMRTFVTGQKMYDILPQMN